MTSQTDPAGVTTYYQYDEFNRLELVRDQRSRILQNYFYHYKQ
jgi:YD repeat-containing protein